METRTHQLGAESVHSRWKAKIEPILTIEPGDTVKMVCRDGFDGQVNPPVGPEDLDTGLYSTIDFRRIAPVTGPIAVRGCQPGDTLEVHVRNLTPFGTGTLVIFPSWVGADILLEEPLLLRQVVAGKRNRHIAGVLRPGRVDVRRADIAQ